MGVGAHVQGGQGVTVVGSGSGRGGDLPDALVRPSMPAASTGRLGTLGDPAGRPLPEPTAHQVWTRSYRADPAAVVIADRHYNRQKVGSPQFVPPGRCVVLLSECRRALWVTSWPFAQYVRHAWPGAWVNILFRNEGAGLSSDLIRAAVAATLAEWPEPPALGLVTFVDAGKTRPKRDPGRCYRRAGFRHVGFTKGGLWAFQLLPNDFPRPVPAGIAPGPLFQLDAAEPPETPVISAGGSHPAVSSVENNH